MDFNKLASRLKELRKKSGYTQQDIADILKIDRSTYAKYENGQAIPPLSKLIRLATLFDVDINYLSGREGRRNNIVVMNDPGVFSKERAKFISFFQALTEEQQNLTLDYMMQFIVANEEAESDNTDIDVNNIE